jgi:hypothetical protein
VASIRITHTHAEGTLLDGSVKGDGVYEIVRQHGFTWFRSIRRIGIRGSRDHPARVHYINRAKAALEAAGHTVKVEIDDRARPATEVEAERDEQLAARQDALDAKAVRLEARGTAAYQQAKQMGDAIPFGQSLQPPTHHSYRADVNYRARMRRTYDHAFSTLKEGESAADRADASRRHQAYLKTGPVTERRIAKLEADRRRIERYVAPCETSGRKAKEGTDGRKVHCPYCGQDVTIADRQIPEHRRGTVDLDWAAQRLAEIDDRLGHERQRLADLIEQGYRKWGPDDFVKGDLVFAPPMADWSPVLRVSRKSLTVPHPFAGGTWTIPYDEVRGRHVKDKHDCLQGPLCHRWHEPPDPDGWLPTAPIDGCGHSTCTEIVNDVARCPACVREHPQRSDA